MSVKLFFAIFGVIAVLFGLGGLLIPDAVGGLYSIEASRGGVLMARYFGGALLAWGLILWSARDFDSTAQRGILLASAIAIISSVPVAAVGTLSGVENALGWTTVLIYLLGAVGSFYFCFTTATSHRTAGKAVGER